MEKGQVNNSSLILGSVSAGARHAGNVPTPYPPADGRHADEAASVESWACTIGRRCPMVRVSPPMLRSYRLLAYENRRGHGRCRTTNNHSERLNIFL